MPEVCIPPYRFDMSDESVVEGFGDEHSLADIARWIMKNRADAEEMVRLLGEMLEEKRLYVDSDGDATLDPTGKDDGGLVALVARDPFSRKPRNPEVFAEMVDRYNWYPDLKRENAVLKEEFRVQRYKAYEERNRLVAFLASIYPSGIAKTDIKGWNPEWHNVVYIDFPWGQASWHFHDDHYPLFEHLPLYTKPYDGHTTEQKYRMMEERARLNMRNRR